MKADVILLTKNSMSSCLEKCVNSIYANIPINRLIVVDGGSTDGTLELLSQYPKTEIIMDTHGNRATARQKGIDAVETEWHVHVDSDVVLCKDWFNRAWKNVDDSVGAVWGVALPVEQHRCNIVYAMSKFYRMSVRDMLVKQMMSERCMTHDTLFRTELIKDIKIPKDLHIWEDEYIGRHIIRKGYKFIKTKNPYCLHYIKTETNNSILNGYLIHKYNIWRFRKILLRFILAVPKALWIYALTRDFYASKWQILTYVLTMKGWLAYK